MGRRCCCQRGCTIFEDDFNRSDSTSLGSGWEEVSGDWQIVSGELRELSGTGIVITTKEHPKDSHTGIWRVVVPLLLSGGTVRLLVNYVPEDGVGGVEEYRYLEVSYVSTEECRLAIGESVDGVDTEWDYVTVPLAEDMTLMVCMNNNAMYGSVSSKPGWVLQECDITDNGGRKSGLENLSGSGTDGIFDDFYWEENYETNTACPTCACDCENRCMPCTGLIATFVRTAGSPATCTGLDGFSLSLKYDACKDNPYAEYPVYLFEGDMSSISCDGGVGTWPDVVRLRLYCPGSGTPEHPNYNACEDWFLCDDAETISTEQEGFSFTAWPEDCIDAPNRAAYPYFCQCDPLIFKFGPFSVWYRAPEPMPSWMLDEYEIHITEA